VSPSGHGYERARSPGKRHDDIRKGPHPYGDEEQGKGRRKDMLMNTSIDAQEQIEMAAHRETTAADLERLAGCGFTAEESVALLWLQQWYQAGGSDRIELMRHWEFLKFLVLTGKVDV
jgi:hypothetical protein